jgi:uncharacterized membrane protein
METTQSPPLPDSSTPRLPGAPQPRHLAAGAGAEFWSEAWRIFSASPGPWIAILIVYVLISIGLAIIPVVGHLAHLVLTPVFIGGVMLGCHALARGEPLSVTHLFEGFKNGRFGPLAILGLLLLAIFIVFGIVMFFGMLMAFGMGGLSALAGQGDPWTIISAMGTGFLVLLLVALAGGMLIAMAFWFAPALVVLSGEEPFGALQKSFAASWTNFGAFLIYGLIYIGLAIVASIPFGLGWLILAPMIAGSCYAGWRQIFGT